MCDCRDRDGDQKAVTSIEVTPEMIEEGYSELLAWSSRDFPDRAMVKDVFEAMMRAALQGQHRNPSEHL